MQPSTNRENPAIRGGSQIAVRTSEALDGETAGQLALTAKPKLQNTNYRLRTKH